MLPRRSSSQLSPACGRFIVLDERRDSPTEAMQPYEGVGLLLKGASQRPMPHQLYLRWEGPTEWVAVPIPMG